MLSDKKSWVVAHFITMMLSFGAFVFFFSPYNPPKKRGRKKPKSKKAKSKTQNTKKTVVNA
jgi:hypothetical protein